MKFFLDTDTCIHYLKGQSAELRSRLHTTKVEDIAIPTIVKAELLVGCQRSSNSKKARNIVDAFLQPFALAPFDDSAAADYAEIRHRLEQRGEIIGPNDLIIAAIVRSQQGILVTHNVREFSRIAELKVQDWLK